MRGCGPFWEFRGRLTYFMIESSRVSPGLLNGLFDEAYAELEDKVVCHDLPAESHR